MKIRIIGTAHLQQMRLARVGIPAIGDITVPVMSLNNLTDSFCNTAMGSPVGRNIYLK